MDEPLNSWTDEREHWRRYEPCFDVPMPNHPIARRLDAILSEHSWSRNRFMRKLRLLGATVQCYKRKDGSWKTKNIPPRRLSIRSEREQTLHALSRAMIFRADYDPDAPFLFEVKANVEELAKMIGQLHQYQPGYDGAEGQYRHGRTAYDPVLGALEDMEAADLIVLVREFDSQTKTHKAMRIFFKPNFFRGFGLTMEDTRTMLSRVRKWRVKNDLEKSAQKKRQSEYIRQKEQQRLATLERPSLRNMLARYKREFLGENKASKRTANTNEHFNQAQKNAKRSSPTHDDSLRVELYSLVSQMPTAIVYDARKKIAQSLGLTKAPNYEANPEADRLLVEMLRTYR